jgi:hypothetical protein
VIDEATKYAEKLEKQGHKVIYPTRDTEQNDTTGYNICKSNLEGIKWADRVDVFYHALSQGIHFDLGQAFALNKKIKVVKVLLADNPNYPTTDNENSKSFPKMMKVWESLSNLEKSI